MKGAIVFTVVFLLLEFTANAQPFAVISNKIHAWQQKEGVIGKGRDVFNEARLAISSSDKLSFLDTLNCFFVLESSDVESGKIYGLIWTGDHRVSYTYYRGSISFDAEGRFTSYMVHLVEKWDVKAIREEEKENGNMIPSSRIYATRVVNNSLGSIKIKSMYFKDFFKPGRD